MKIVAALIVLLSLFACSTDRYPYVELKEATSYFWDKYGVPVGYEIKETYEDGETRILDMYWVLPFESDVCSTDIHGELTYCDYVWVRVWHQPYQEKAWRFWHYGWKPITYRKY